MKWFAIPVVSIVLASSFSIVLDWEKIGSILAVLTAIFAGVSWIATQVWRLGSDRQKVITSIDELRREFLDHAKIHETKAAEICNELQYLRSRLDNHIDDHEEE